MDFQLILWSQRNRWFSRNMRFRLLRFQSYSLGYVSEVGGTILGDSSLDIIMKGRKIKCPYCKTNTKQWGYWITSCKALQFNKNSIGAKLITVYETTGIDDSSNAEVIWKYNEGIQRYIENYNWFALIPSMKHR